MTVLTFVVFIPLVWVHETFRLNVRLEGPKPNSKMRHSDTFIRVADIKHDTYLCKVQSNPIRTDLWPHDASAVSFYGVATWRRINMRRFAMAWLTEHTTSARCGRPQIGSHWAFEFGPKISHTFMPMSPW